MLVITSTHRTIPGAGRRPAHPTTAPALFSATAPALLYLAHPWARTSGIRQLLLHCSTSGIHALAMPSPFPRHARAFGSAHNLGDCFDSRVRAACPGASALHQLRRTCTDSRSQVPSSGLRPPSPASGRRGLSLHLLRRSSDSNICVAAKHAHSASRTMDPHDWSGGCCAWPVRQSDRVRCWFCNRLHLTAPVPAACCRWPVSIRVVGNRARGGNG
jgi:hypothetical protein